MEVVAALAVVGGTIAQAVTGFGLALVAAPFLVAAYGAPEGVQLTMVISLVTNVVILASGHRHLDRGAAARLLAPAIVTSVVIGLLVRGSSTDGLTVVAGVLCLVAVAMVAAGRSSHRVHSAGGATVIGALSGAMNVVAGIGGPPVVLFGATAGWSPEVARPTLQAFFLGINLTGLATLGLPEERPVLAAIAIVVGLAVGQPLARRSRDEQVRVAVLVLAAVGSLLAIGRGLT